MKYETKKGYSEERFRRITGVKRATFEKMLEILRPKLREKLSKGGRKPTLTLEEMLLAALEYWREYRTYAHIAASYGLHESNMYRLIEQFLKTCTWFPDVKAHGCVPVSHIRFRKLL